MLFTWFKLLRNKWQKIMWLKWDYNIEGFVLQHYYSKMFSINCKFNWFHNATNIIKSWNVCCEIWLAFQKFDKKLQCNFSITPLMYITHFLKYWEDLLPTVGGLRATIWDWTLLWTLDWDSTACIPLWTLKTL